LAIGSAGTILSSTGTAPQWSTPASLNIPTGTGSSGVIVKWTGTNTVGSSIVTDTGTNVGIGVSSPSQKLVVAGNIGLQAGANAFIGTLDNYALSLRTNNTDRVYITNAGNVGIGTTSPSQALHVVGNIGIQAGANAFIGTLDNYALSLRTNNTDRVYITNSGNVGIGTTSPGQKLTVAGNIGLQAGANAFIGTLDNYALSLRTNNTDRVFILNDGKVGIGTTSPVQALDVVGNIRSSGQFISTVATGTAPLSVSSTTLCTNLNADMLDSLHADDFVAISFFFS
jgi:ethanolamine utilization microcompartment shell protein EutS